MADRLADELLAMILDVHLRVPDDDFSYVTNHRSPFALRQLCSSSVALAVCKRWLRIGTPLLYETVILRSSAQAQALARTLKSIPALGRYIKKFRVEGGYGASAANILRAAPNIRDLWMTLELWTSDRILPMCAVLPTIDLRRLVVFAPSEMPENANVRAARDALSKCIPSWNNLRVIRTTPPLLNPYTKMIGEAIQSATQLETVCIDADNATLLQWLPTLTLFIRACKAQRLGVVLTPTNERTLQQLFRDLSPSERRKLVAVDHSDKSGVADECSISQFASVPRDPAYVPLASCELQLRHKVWGHIFSFVATPGFPGDTKLACMLVCKEFKEIATPVFVRHLDLESHTSLLSLQRLLQANEGISQYVDSLQIRSEWRDGSSGVSSESERRFALLSILPHLSQLTTINLDLVRGLPDFSAVENASESLRFAKIRLKTKAPELHSPHFTNLRSLDLTFEPLGYPGDPISTATGMSQLLTFPSLETLHLRGRYLGNILSALCHVRLPHLRSLSLPQLNDARKEVETFLKAHGIKLRYLLIGSHRLDHARWCPELETLYIEVGSKEPRHNCLEAFNRMPRLETILCDHISVGSWTSLSPPGTPATGWQYLFNALRNRKKFPALRMIRSESTRMWPLNERAISRNPLLEWAGELKEAGIRLVDGEDNEWKPRLTFRTKRRRGAAARIGGASLG